jgi:putative PEP-CTERM system TPR-repeat lipoprotein
LRGHPVTVTGNTVFYDHISFGELLMASRFQWVRRAALIIFITLSSIAFATTVIPRDWIPDETGLPKASVDQIRRLVAQKQYDRALAEVATLEKQQPRNAAIATLRGGIYLARGDAANARKNLERSIAQNPGSLFATVQLAHVDLLENRPDVARRRLETVLATDPNNAGAMLALAAVAASTHKEMEYVSWLERAAKADPALERPQVLLADYYVARHDPQRALGVARTFAERNPDSPVALDTLGAVQLAAGQTTNAVRTYTKLAGMLPEEAQVHYRLATALVGAHDYDSARTAIQRALALKRDFIEAKVLLSSSELAAGRYEEARRVARDIQYEHPKAGAGWQLEGDVAMAQKDYAAAEKAYDKAFSIRKSGTLAARLHAAVSAQGRDRDAEARILAWIKEQPKDRTARTYLAGVYSKSGRRKEAIEQYTTLLQSDPNNAMLLNGLAWTYQEEKDSRALATAEKAYQLDPGNADVVDTLGWILVQNGNTARGLEMLNRAIDLAPNAQVIRYHLAAALAKSGDVGRARREVERALQKDGDFPQRADAEALLAQLPK